jgi:hypothetical protein
MDEKENPNKSKADKSSVAVDSGKSDYIKF